MRRWRVIRRFKWRLPPPALALVFALTGCAVDAPRHSPASAPALFYITASVVTQEKNNGAKRKFSLLWTRRDTRPAATDKILVRNPLGNTIGRLEVKGDVATLEWEGKTYPPEETTRLTKKMFGYSLPVKAFGYWLNNQTDPASPAREVRSEAGDLLEIQQQQWRVQYLRRDDEGRPQQLQVDGPGGSARVVIRQWLER